MSDCRAQIIRPIRIACSVVVSFLMAWGITRAAGDAFQSQVEQFRQQAQADQQRQGLDIMKHRKELFAKYPCPTIQLASIPTVAPGGTADIVATGTFADGTGFFFDYAEVEVVKQTASAAALRRPLLGASGFLAAGAATARPAAGSTYRATLRVSPKAAFGFVRLHAYAPVSAGHTEVPALFIGAKNNWEVTAKNGWRVSVKMQGDGFTLSQNNKSAEGRYTAEFFRPGEAKPFETMDARATFQDYQADRHLTFSLTQPSSPYEAEMNQMSAKMGELSKMSEKEQEKFMTRFQELQVKMMENMQAMIADPAAANKKQAEFGCYTLQIRAGIDQGALLCGQKVGTVEVTGVRTLIAANRVPTKK